MRLMNNLHLHAFDRRRGLLAAEQASLVYGGLTALLLLCCWEQVPGAGSMLAMRFFIGLGIGLGWMAQHHFPRRWVTFLRIAFQLALLSYWYPEIYSFNALFPNYDHLFATAEQALFGGQPALWFWQRFPSLWVSEAFNLGYFFYYPMMLVVALYYLFRRFERLDRMAFILMGSFFLYYAIYICLPVAGPQFYFPAIGHEQAVEGVFPALADYFHYHTELLPAPGGKGGFFYGLVEASQQAGERPIAAFPSSHVGISTILMLLSWKVSRRLCLLLFPIYALLCGATVYIQAHYLIDVVGGLLSALLFYLLTDRFYDLALRKRWFTSSLSSY